MRTIKRGDRGVEVRVLQRVLGISADGVFGAQTEKAVKDYQKTHKDSDGNPLSADGIVGARTWAAMGVTDSKCVDPSVIYAPLKACLTRTPNRTIKYLAIHYTAGGSSAPGRAIGMKDSWEKSKKASADFGVDDRDMVQFNPDPKNYRCWSVGDPKNQYSGGGQLYGTATNSNTISIEICSSLVKGYDASKANHDGWFYTDAALENAVKLAKILMAKFNIPIERVVRHYDITGKLCPGIVGWNNGRLYTADGKATSRVNGSSKWEEFKRRLIRE